MESEGAETERCGCLRGAVLGIDGETETAACFLWREVTQVTERLTRVGGGGVGGTAIQVGANNAGLQRGDCGEVGAVVSWEAERLELDEEVTRERLSNVHASALVVGVQTGDARMGGMGRKPLAVKRC